MKQTIILLLFAVQANAQIIFQIGDKKAEIVPSVTYDTAVCLSLNQMDNIMLELLKCDSIAEVAKISDLQLLKYKDIVSMQTDQINAAKAAINVSDKYNKVLMADVINLNAEVEQKTKQVKRNRKGFFAASLIAAVELLLLL